MDISLAQEIIPETIQNVWNVSIYQDVNFSSGVEEVLTKSKARPRASQVAGFQALTVKDPTDALSAATNRYNNKIAEMAGGNF